MPRFIWSEAAFGIWDGLATPHGQRLFTRPEGTEEIAWSEYQAYRTTSKTGRSVCYACGARITAGAQALRVFDQSRSGSRFDENQRLMHIAPCIPRPTAFKEG
jgi:hypothetical protein